MGRLGNIKYRNLIKKIKKLGYVFYREGRGSHELWIDNDKNKALPIPKHNSKDIAIGTLRTIIKELNISVEEFIKL